MVIISYISRTIKPGLEMGCQYGQDQRNIFVTETRIYSQLIHNNDVTTIKLVLSLQVRRVRSVQLYLN